MEWSWIFYRISFKLWRGYRLLLYMVCYSIFSYSSHWEMLTSIFCSFNSIFLHVLFYRDHMCTKQRNLHFSSFDGKFLLYFSCTHLFLQPSVIFPQNLVLSGFPCRSSEWPLFSVRHARDIWDIARRWYFSWFFSMMLHVHNYISSWLDSFKPFSCLIHKLIQISWPPFTIELAFCRLSSMHANLVAINNGIGEMQNQCSFTYLPLLLLSYELKILVRIEGFTLLLFLQLRHFTALTVI